MGKWENKTGKRAGTGTGTVRVFSRPFSRFPFSAGKIPAGIPVFVVVGYVTCVGNVNCCLHVFQRELWIRDSLYLCFLVIRVFFSMLFMHSCSYFIELNIWSGCMYFPVLSYRFPIVIGMLPTDWFRSRYPVIPISFSRPIFPFPTKKYNCGNG